MPLNAIMSALPALDAEQLRTVIEACRALLEAPEDPAEEQPPAEGGKRKRESHARAWKETFYVPQGKKRYGPYARLSWRENGKKKHKHLGRLGPQ